MTIELDHVTKRFGQQLAVDDISFVARPGITGFLGPNGAGKSTTMRLITGYLRPDGGSIRVLGEEVDPDKSSLRQRIGYLPEHNPLYPEMYVKEYLGFVGRVHSLPNLRKRVDEVVDLVGLTPERRKRIGQLSKGYRQRVGLAQALIHDPDVLILDEPTSGLDPNQLSEIRNVIRSLGEQKIVLLSTHIMQEVQAMCGRVLIISRGKIVADDPIDRLQQRVRGQSAVYFMCSKAVDIPTIEAIEGVAGVRREGKGYLVTAIDDRELRPQVAQLCTSRGWDLLELRTEGDSVETVFQRLTQSAQA